MATYTESFNKANAATLGPDLTWTEVGGLTAWKVFGNTAVIQDDGDGHARAEHDTVTDDQFAESSRSRT